MSRNPPARVGDAGVSSFTCLEVMQDDAKRPFSIRQKMYRTR